MCLGSKTGETASNCAQRGSQHEVGMLSTLYINNACVSTSYLYIYRLATTNEDTQLVTVARAQNIFFVKLDYEAIYDNRKICEKARKWNQ